MAVSKITSNSKHPTSVATQELYSQLEDNLLFHVALEQEIQKMKYGQISVNVILINGRVILKPDSFVVQKRIRY